LQALASTLDEAELSDLKDQFDAIDVDKNGSISLDEMRQVKVILHIQLGLLFGTPLSHHPLLSIFRSFFFPNKDGFHAGPC
jgi:hypothetical protein